MNMKHQTWRRFLLVTIVLISCLLVFAACDEKGPVVEGISIQASHQHLNLN